MTRSEFLEWLTRRRRWSLSTAATVLGLTRATVSRYATEGDDDIPKTVALAISAIEADLPPWPERKEPRA